jgi:hypothetical protein
MDDLVTFNNARTSFSISSSASSDGDRMDTESSPPQVPDIVITETEDIPRGEIIPASTPLFGPQQCLVCHNLLSRLYELPVNSWPAPDLHNAVLQHYRCHSPYLFMEPQFRHYAEVLTQAATLGQTSTPTYLAHYDVAMVDTEREAWIKDIDTYIETAIFDDVLDFETFAAAQASEAASDGLTDGDAQHDSIASDPIVASIDSFSQGSDTRPVRRRQDSDYSTSSESTLSSVSRVNKLKPSTHARKAPVQQVSSDPWGQWQARGLAEYKAERQAHKAKVEAEQHALAESKAKAATFAFLQAQEQADWSDEFVERVTTNERVKRWILAVENTSEDPPS